jgi:toxin FitB
MYLLDTNIISEARRGTAAASKWLEDKAPESLFLSAITLGEIERGIVKLKLRDERASERLEDWKLSLIENYADRILTVSSEVAMKWGALSVGRTIGVADALIGATAIVHGLAMVTRNVKNFEGTGVKLINPWS